jgi:hypothetical protein
MLTPSIFPIKKTGILTFAIAVFLNGDFDPVNFDPVNFPCKKHRDFDMRNYGGVFE